MKQSLSFLFILCFVQIGLLTPLLAQRSEQYLKRNSGAGIRAGVNFCEILLKKTPSVSPAGGPPPIGGLHPRTGFYLGSYYSKEWTAFFIGQVNFNYQMKGLLSKDRTGKLVSSDKYHYIGLNPTIGVKPVKGMIISAGPEANLLVAKETGWGHGVPLEFGVIGRLSYSIGRIGLELATFKAFTRFDETRSLGPRIDFFNRNWQAGLTYRLTNN